MLRYLRITFSAQYFLRKMVVIDLIRTKISDEILSEPLRKGAI